jgi:cyclomaltodextrinase / maltogenic alpha-amylase / neopullulanase
MCNLKSSLLLLLAFLFASCAAGLPTTAQPADPPFSVEERVPEWAKDAVWYQIFPERFRNGDPTNDPTRQSLEFPIEGRVPASWEVTSWTSDWYARAGWETEKGDDFYEHGVFDRRFGGDLQGVIDKLDYLDSLGVNALYFNPVFYARSLHKYDGNSFHHVDPHFGPDPEGDFALMAQETADPATWHWTAADLLFLDLIREARARDMRVIIDGVFNHTGRDFFAFADIMERQAKSPYVDWYVIHEFEDPAVPGSEFRYEGWWGVHTLPEFAENEDGTDLHPGPKQYVMDITRRWMRPVVDGLEQAGIDGWRLDVANEVPTGFWRDWHALVYELNPEAYTVAEIWDHAEDFLSAGGFSATMNYHAFAYPVKGFLVDNSIPPSRFAEILESRKSDYPEPVRYILQNLIDSHDTDRLASMVVNARDYEDYDEPHRFDYDRNVSPRWYPAYDVRKPYENEWDVVRLVGLFQMTYLGAPMVYYGTEAGVWGADDPDDRKPMIWPDLVYDVEREHPLGHERPADAVTFDFPLFRFYQEAIALRNGSEALRRGTYRTLVADDDANVFAFGRSLGEDVYVVVLNRSDDAQNVSFSTPAGIYELALSTTDHGLRLSHAGTGIELNVAPRSGVVLRRTSGHAY